MLELLAIQYVCDCAGVVKELVSGALEEGDTHMLTCGLLLARQASLEGAHIFTPYQHWFQVNGK